MASARAWEPNSLEAGVAVEEGVAPPAAALEQGCPVSFLTCSLALWGVDVQCPWCGLPHLTRALGLQSTLEAAGLALTLQGGLAHPSERSRGPLHSWI